MTDYRAVGEQVWQGEAGLWQWNKALEDSVAIDLTDDAAYVASRGVVGNVTLIRTNDGLVMIDSGNMMVSERIQAAARGWDGARVNTLIYTHGHLDHVFGAPLYDAEAEANGWRRPVVVAHENVARRFARYRLTAGLNGEINGRQFGRALEWPTEYRQPDRTYAERLDLSVGGVALELHHGIGETDDQTWVWQPDRRMLVTGDFIIWAAPNAGNPQKVQRYADGWARALTAMLAKEAEILVPGHGPAVYGAERVRRMLEETIRFLEHVHDHTVAGMNRGESLDRILHGYQVPEDWLRRPYLNPSYDDPEFLVHNVWRLYGGWYDGNPAHLKPAPEAELARELAVLAGGAGALAERAEALRAEGELRLAGHLVELAARAAPDDGAVHGIRAKVYGDRVAAETSLMAKGIFGAAV
ncbi:MAG: alkyl sulfatase dimerization domain-containing protein, partial [Alphaproteobacteria bacterium]|nr:alkyl sulfatase dimerization domain-containing protein [Alphaproteobacteria bacterium]